MASVCAHMVMVGLIVAMAWLVLTSVAVMECVLKVNVSAILGLLVWTALSHSLVPMTVPNTGNACTGNVIVTLGTRDLIVVMFSCVSPIAMVMVSAHMASVSATRDFTGTAATKFINVRVGATP